MKIKPEQLDKLSKLLLENYRAKELITPNRDDATIVTKIKAVISQNFAEEEAIEDEVVVGSLKQSEMHDPID